MLGAFTVIPENPSMLEAPSARHSQPPLDIFCLWLPLRSTISTLLLICTERHIPTTKDISGFSSQTETQVCLGTKFREVFTILNSGAEGGERREVGMGGPGKKIYFCFPNSDMVSITVFWMTYGKEERGGKWFSHLHLSTFASFFLRRGLCLERTTFRVFYSNILQTNSDVFNSKSSTLEKKFQV